MIGAVGGTKLGYDISLMTPMMQIIMMTVLLGEDVGNKSTLILCFIGIFYFHALIRENHRSTKWLAYCCYFNFLFFLAMILFSRQMQILYKLLNRYIFRIFKQVTGFKIICRNICQIG